MYPYAFQHVHKRRGFRDDNKAALQQTMSDEAAETTIDIPSHMGMDHGSLMTAQLGMIHNLHPNTWLIQYAVRQTRRFYMAQGENIVPEWEQIKLYYAENGIDGLP